MTDTTREIRPLRTTVPESALEDLRARLASARLPERETVAHSGPGRQRWQQGVPLEDLSALVRYWRTEYDWRPFEARLHEIGQHSTRIDGLDIGFLHRPSSRPDATPLLMTHGWPGSIAEFVDVIDDLAEPSDPSAPAFHVVAPALPGFGFSGKPSERGWGIERIAGAWVELMDRLGYPRFLAHGGDWGGVITTILGGRFPRRVMGIHTLVPQPPPGLSLDGLSDDDRAKVERSHTFWAHRAAYAKVQASSPQTIGYALVDSPVGLLGWILEKFAQWSDTEDSPFETISRDRFLDNVTLYWLTRSGASAARIYAESHDSLDPDLRVEVPTAVTSYPRDIETWPRPWAEERFRNIVRWHEPESGGHFPSLEEPAQFVADVRAALAAVLGACGGAGS